MLKSNFFKTKTPGTINHIKAKNIRKPANI